MGASWPGYATIALDRCPLEPGDGSFRHSHRPGSEGTFRVDTPGRTLIGRWIEAKHLLRICNFVMVHGQVALDKELLVVRIEGCLLDVLAGKGLNRRPGLPEAHRDELGMITLHTPKQPGPTVAGRALIALNAGL